MTVLGGSSPPRLLTGRRARPAAAPSRRTGGDRATVPALEARPQGPAQRFAAALDFRHPVVIFLTALVGGALLLIGVSILLGLLVTHVLGTGAVLGRPDGAFVRDLVRERTGTLDDVSSVGSAVGGAPVLPIIVGLVALVAVI